MASGVHAMPEYCSCCSPCARVGAVGLRCRFRWGTDLLLIGGVDEAGRGPLAGPVVAAVVLLNGAQVIPGVRDSKKLSAARREQLALEIRECAQDWAIGMASVAEIDRLNILQATLLAMYRAVDGLRQMPDCLRIDGNQTPAVPAHCSARIEMLVGGDDLCPAIGAASILAKVTRDALMRELHTNWPDYGFDRHMGYPTAEHRRALLAYGPTPEHRMSFRPVREAAAQFRSGLPRTELPV
jgi:ribonuclease HII